MMVYILPHVYLPSKYLLWCMFSSFAYLKFVFMFLNYCVVRVLHIFQRKKLLLAMCSLNISSRFAVWLLIFISSVAQSCPTLWDPTDCGAPGFPVHHQFLSLLKLMSTESVMPSSHLILCRPLLLLSSIFPSIRVFSNESALCIRWPKYWSFSFSISPCNEYSGLLSFRMDWLDLLAVQGTLKSLLQHHSSKASILWHSAFFIVQLSHPSLTTGKTIAQRLWHSQ